MASLITCKQLNNIFNRWLPRSERLAYFTNPTRGVIVFNGAYTDRVRDLLRRFFYLDDSCLDAWALKPAGIQFNQYLTDVAIAEIDMFTKLHATDSLKIYNPENKPLRFIFFDTETCEQLDPDQLTALLETHKIADPKKQLKKRKEIRRNGIVIPWLIIYKVEGYSQVCYSFYQEDKHRAFMVKLAQISKTHCVVLTGHNIQYDIRAMLPVFESNGLKTYSKLRNGDFYLNGYSTHTNAPFSISYLDTFFFYRASLEKAASIPKTEVPYGLVNVSIHRTNNEVVYFSLNHDRHQTFPLQNYLDYGAQDVLAVEKLHKQRNKTIAKVQQLAGLEPEPVKLCHLSQSGLAEWFIRTLADKERPGTHEGLYRPEVKFTEYQIERRSTLGGWSPFDKTAIYHQAAPENAIYKFDVTSLYPFIASMGMPGGQLYSKLPQYLRHGEYVKWWLIQPRPETTPQFKDKYAHLSIGFHRQSWFKPDLNGKVYLVDQLLRTYQEYYKNFDECFKVERCFYQEIYHHYGDAFRHLYPIKEQADRALQTETDQEKINDLQLTRSTVKLLLNSCIGKLQQRTFDEAKYQVDREEIKEQVPIGARRLRSSKSGFYVPQFGRAILANAVTKAINAGYKVYRCDTDSILLEAPKAVNGEYPSKLVDIFGQWWEPVGLGGWTLEGIYERHYSFGVAKKYILEPFEDDPDKAKWMRKGVALSGIRGLPELVTDLMLSNPQRYQDLKKILVPGKNVIFIDAKNSSFKSKKYKQILIQPVDVQLVQRGAGKEWPIEYAIKLGVKDFEAIPISQYVPLTEDPQDPREEFDNTPLD